MKNKQKSFEWVKTYLEKHRKQAKIELLEELIAIWKPRPKLEMYTTNVILLELEVRLDILKNEN